MWQQSVYRFFLSHSQAGAHFLTPFSISGLSSLTFKRCNKSRQTVCPDLVARSIVGTFHIICFVIIFFPHSFPTAVPAPTGLKFSDITADNMTVSWTAPTVPKPNEIDRYIIHYHPVDDENDNTERVVDGNVHRVILRRM